MISCFLLNLAAFASLVETVYAWIGLVAGGVCCWLSDTAASARFAFTFPELSLFEESFWSSVYMHTRSVASAVIVANT